MTLPEPGMESVFELLFRDITLLEGSRNQSEITNLNVEANRKTNMEFNVR